MFIIAQKNNDYFNRKANLNILTRTNVIATVLGRVSVFVFQLSSVERIERRQTRTERVYQILESNRIMSNGRALNG